MDIGKQIIDGLEEFLGQLKENKPIKVTRVTRKETPDGPMHEFTDLMWTPNCESFPNPNE